MTVKKLSISLDSEVADRAQKVAAAEGVSLSAWLSAAAEQAADFADARAALLEYIETYGEPDEQLMRQTREELTTAGVGRPETPAETANRHAALARLYENEPRQEEPTAHEYRKAG